jgi:hypothetical protein
MQDLKPADGKEVFILTDSVSLLGSKGIKNSGQPTHPQEIVAPA